jgi:hypothetical protein
MGLDSLQSAYSFANDKNGYIANENKNVTRFIYNSADEVTAAYRPGFTDLGYMSPFDYRRAGNEFAIGDQGTATRLNQLGEGSQFPIGPKGQKHNFDIKRTGFSSKLKYGSIYKSNSKAGLANTYTENSPIDDMYNIVKVRDVASDRIYAREPFILRGIQRNENSKPQRWGPTITADLPRGGILTAGNRILNDLGRIGKFLITPKGLLWNVKQIGQQLMNPNVEGTNGEVGRFLTNPNSTKIWTPAGLLASLAGNTAGIHPRRHGLLPFDLGISPSTYEEVHKLRNNPLNFLDDAVKSNRLVKMRRDMMPTLQTIRAKRRADKQAIGESIPNSMFGNALLDALLPDDYVGKQMNVISGKTGPASIGGLGRTTFRRAEDTLNPSLNFTSTANSTIDTRNDATTELKGVQDAFGQYNGLRGKVEEADFDGIGTSSEKLTDTAEKARPSNDLEIGNVKAYTTRAYGDIQKTAKKNSAPSSKKGSGYTLDFMTGENFDAATTPLEKLFSDAGEGNVTSTIDKRYPLGESVDGLCNVQLLIYKANSTEVSETVKFPGYITSLDESIDNSVELELIPGTQLTIQTKEAVADKSINVGFLIACNNNKELRKYYKEISKLQEHAARSVAGDVEKEMALSVGNIYSRVIGFMSSLSISVDTETPWNLSPGKKVPLYLDVSFTFDVPKIGQGDDLNQIQFGYKG